MISTTPAERLALLQFQDSIPDEHPSSGTEDDDDDRDDEHPDENEAPVRAVDDETEAPEEFEIDDEDEAEDERGHPEDDDLDV